MIHKLTRSQAHIAKLATTPVWFFVVIGLLVTSLVGCGPITEASGNSVAEIEASDFNSSVQCVIDAGIVFANEESYLCVPLSRVGIMDSDEVVSVQTSCDCTQASIVQFYKSSAETTRALRIDFTRDSATASTKRAPSNLSVEVTLLPHDGRVVTAKIQFMCAIRAESLNHD